MGKRKIHRFSEQEQSAEDDWCFECKDGGELVICDYQNCGKVYHPDRDCTGKDHSFFGTAKSWICARHYCYICVKSSKYYCLGCPNAVCKKCFEAPGSSDFTFVRGNKGLCIDCFDLVLIIEQNLEHDSDGNKISLDGRETYEALFKEYWEIIKVNERLTRDDVFAAQVCNCRKVHNSLRNASEEEDKTLDRDEDYMGKRKSTKRKMTNRDEDYMGKRNSTKRKMSNSLKFIGWSSKPLFRFLACIGKYHEESSLSQWDVRCLIYDYIKKRNLYDAKDKSKFLPDEKLFLIFGKKVMSLRQIYPLLERHLSDNFDERDEEENNDENTSSLTDKYPDDQTCMTNQLSGLGKPLLKKGDLTIKSGCFASISASNIKLIYLKKTLVLELSKQPESFVDKVVGAFVRVKVTKQMTSHQLARVVGVELDEIFKGVLLQVSIMPKAVPISELSDCDFTEEECEDLWQKLKTNLLQKITVAEFQEKANSLHEDITKHGIATRLVYLQHQIDRANLRGRQREKFSLLEEKEELEKPWKQEQLLRKAPLVSPELMEAEYDPEEGITELTGSR